MVQFSSDGINRLHVWSYPEDDQVWANFDNKPEDATVWPVWDVTEDVEKLIYEAIQDLFEFQNRCMAVFLYDKKSGHTIVKPCISPCGHGMEHQTFDGIAFLNSTTYTTMPEYLKDNFESDLK